MPALVLNDEVFHINFGAAIAGLNNLETKKMTEATQEKDYLMVYIALVALVFISVLLVVKSSESDKFAPIKEQLNEEHRLMNIRVLN